MGPPRKPSRTRAHGAQVKHAGAVCHLPTGSLGGGREECATLAAGDARTRLHRLLLAAGGVRRLAHLMGPIVRGHWSVENSLHWTMEMIFRDDACRIRTDHAPANFTTVKQMVLSLIRRAPGKDSLRLRRKVAAWDDDFLAGIVAA